MMIWDETTIILMAMGFVGSGAGLLIVMLAGLSILRCARLQRKTQPQPMLQSATLTHYLHLIPSPYEAAALPSLSQAAPQHTTRMAREIATAGAANQRETTELPIAPADAATDETSRMEKRAS